MPTRRCRVCGDEEYMPYRCKFCEDHYCARHRLPENHDCDGLSAYQKRLREEGKLMQPEPDLLEPQVSRGARARAWFGDLEDRVFAALEGRAAMVMLGIIGVVFVLELVVRQALGRAWFDRLFVLSPHFYLEPWTILTSIFSHGGFNHLLGNAIVLIFFGPAVERILGSRRFTYLFLGTGVAAGLGQVVIFAHLLPALGLPGSQAGVLGASGAIMGMLGALTLLAPRLTVLLFFIVPTPLWLVTVLYATYDLLFVFNPFDNVAHLAHLIGLGLGLWYAKRLKDAGLRVRMGGGQRGGGVPWRDYF